MKKERVNGLTGKFIVVTIVLILLSTLILAENDPGHDTLYIEEQGDSELNGSLNVSNNMSVEGGRTYQGSGLTVYGNSYTETPVEAYVSGTTGSHLYLDGQGNIYIKYYGGDTVYIGRTDVTATDLNVSGALYVQGSTAMVNGKNICLQDGTNCPSELGTGNISGVYGDDIYIYNGSDNGEVTLVFNETKLNATIEARATAVGDGNNYTTNIGFNETGSTIQLNLARTGMENLTATFTDTDTDTWWSITGSLYLWNNSNVLTINETKLNATINAKITAGSGNISGAGTSGTLAKFTADGTIANSVITEINSVNISADSGTLFVDGTNDRVGIGVTSPISKLEVENANTTSNLYGIYVDQNDPEAYGIHIHTEGGSGLRVMTSINSGTTPALDIENSDGSMLVVTNAANVGIGTAGPAHKLEVNGTDETTGLNVLKSGQGSSITNDFTTSGVSFPRSFGLGIMSGAGYTEDIAVTQPGWTGGFGGYIGLWSDVNGGEENETTMVGVVSVPRGTGSGSAFGLYTNLANASSEYVRWGIYSTGEDKNYFSGNVGIGITSPSAKLEINGTGDLLNISNATSSTLYVTEGKVGIGTTAPGYPLQVIGWLRATNFNQENSQYIGWSDTLSEYAFWDSGGNMNILANGASSNISFYTNGSATAKMTLTNAGNLGIGTTSPEGKLDVTLDNGVKILANTDAVYAQPQLRIRGYQDTADQKPVGYVSFYNHNMGSDVARIAGGSNGSSDRYLSFEVRNASGTMNEQLRIDENGYVGIGTSNPLVDLQIDGSIVHINYDWGELGLGTSRTFNRLTIDNNVNVGLVGKKNVWVGIDSDSSGTDATFGVVTNDAWLNGTETPLFVVTEAGLVGIGITAPTAKLHVNGSINVTSGNDICIEGGNCLSTVSASSGGNLSSTGATAGYIPQFQNTSLLNNSVIFQNGTNIGIGTTNPGAYKLRVFGGNVAIDGASTESTSPELALSTGNNTGGSTYINQYGGADHTGDIIGGMGFSNFNESWALTQVSKIEVFRGAGGAAEGYMSFWTKTQNGTIGQRMRINPDGNIGIGYTSPTVKLDVNGTINATNILINGTPISTGGGGNLSSQGATPGYIPQFQNGTILNNSIISQSENTLTINGNISMPTNFYIGNGAAATGSQATAIGYQAQATAIGAIAMGYQTQATGDYSMIIGYAASATGNYSLALGLNSGVTSEYAVAIGYYSKAIGDRSVALGSSANASEYSTAIGNSAKALSYSVALGSGAVTTGIGATALGYGTNASAYSSAIGEFANTTGSYATAIGYQASATADYATAIGYQTQATAQDAFAFGRGVINNVANSSKFGGAMYVNGNINATTYNVSAVNCIVFDSGGKICTGS